MRKQVKQNKYANVKIHLSHNTVHHVERKKLNPENPNWTVNLKKERKYLRKKVI